MKRQKGKYSAKEEEVTVGRFFFNQDHIFLDKKANRCVPIVNVSESTFAEKGEPLARKIGIFATNVVKTWSSDEKYRAMQKVKRVAKPYAYNNKYEVRFLCNRSLDVLAPDYIHDGTAIQNGSRGFVVPRVSFNLVYATKDDYKDVVKSCMNRLTYCDY